MLLQWLRKRLFSVQVSTIAPVSRQFRTRLEQLEDRLAPAVYTVLNTNDSGMGSFREAVASANVAQDADSIVFNIAGAGVKTITLDTEIEITSPIAVDGWSQGGPGYNGTPLISLTKSLTAMPGTKGITLNDSYNSEIKGLNIQGFDTGVGIYITGGANNTIINCFIGTDTAGSAVASNEVGIKIENSSNNKIGDWAVGTGNVISGNLFQGIIVTGEGSGYNSILRNRIGTNFVGTGDPNPMGNQSQGILIDNAYGYTSIGYNVISGNGSDGILINNSNYNTLFSNLVGTTEAGTNALGNALNGVKITGESSNNQIGHHDLGGNIISGNARAGVRLDGGDIFGTLVESNTIGLASDLETALANGSVQQSDGGIVVVDANDTYIQYNIVSANFGAGIAISGGAVADIHGNYIGTDYTGTLDRGNTLDGIYVPGSYTIDIGLPSNQAVNRNLISGNGGDGIHVISSTDTNIRNNYIGTNAAGDAAIQNAGNGILIEGNSTYTLIGGLQSDAGNLISGNGGDGIKLTGTSTFTTVQANFIGTDKNAVTGIGNTGNGVSVTQNSSDNTIGGSAVQAENYISGNTGIGIDVRGINNTIDFNVVGLNAALNSLANAGGWMFTVLGNTWGPNNLH